MINRLFDLLREVFTNIFVFGAVFLVVLGSILWYVQSRGAADSLIEQSLIRQGISTKAGTNAIQSFFDLTGRSLATFSENPQLLDSKLIDGELEKFISNWEGTPVTGVIFADDKGIIRAAANKADTKDIGSSVADREYFKWARNSKKGDYHVSPSMVSRLGPTKGQFITPITVPVIDSKNSFRGVLALGISLSELTKTYLLPLKTTDKSEVYLLGDKGDFLYSHSEKLIGQNAFDYLSSNPFLGSQTLTEVVKKEMEKDYGELKLVYPAGLETIWPLEERLITYSTIQLSSDKWFLVVATPTKEALVFMTPFYTRQVFVLVITFLALIVFSVSVARIIGCKECLKSHRRAHK